MLTRQDRTVVDALALVDQLRPHGLGHIGFKDVGVEVPVLRRLADAIRAAGATSYMEVVNPSPEAALSAAATAAEIGVDYLLGGGDVDLVMPVIAPSGVRLLPFPGVPRDHPTRLGGTPERIAEDCRRFMDRGCAGCDLLAYRATDADPISLVRAAREALGEGRLVVAGSVNTPARIRAIDEAGADAFTIGSALFDGSFAPRCGALGSQIGAVHAAMVEGARPA